MSRIFYVWLFLIHIDVYAHVPEDGDIRATFGPFGYATHELRHQFESPFMGGGGLEVEGDLNPHGGLVISFFYLDKVFSVKESGMTITERAKRLYIATGYRHWFNKKYSLALAFFSSYSMGDPETIRNDFLPAAGPKTSASDMTEYGFDLSFQHEIYSKKRWASVVDVRYSYSVTPKGDEDSNHYGIIFGLKYFVQARDTKL